MLKHPLCNQLTRLILNLLCIHFLLFACGQKKEQSNTVSIAPSGKIQDEEAGTSTYAHLLNAQAWEKKTLTMGTTGNIKIHKDFPSKELYPHTIEVLLPPNYENSDQRYPVLYMHDGHNAFNPETASYGTDWAIDEVTEKLWSKSTVKPFIVVAIWVKSEVRRSEYMPEEPRELVFSEENQKEFSKFSDEKIYSDKYLSFLVDEVKPFIDKTYKTLPDQSNTYVMGSSMGGLISAYAICKYPDIFYGAGCVSTHWPALDGIFIEYLKDNLPDPANHKIYWDYGTETLDKDYEPYQKRVDKLMEKKGYKEGENWITKGFEGHEHSEKDWRRRVYIPISFFFG